mmetsp:Transcript_14628/g.52653  ORF Transcript_14628/g.52653 Transcript_14628/m.52653 type:complete len:289 (+) Transcript_14628:2418-3284(+)
MVPFLPTPILLSLGPRPFSHVSRSSSASLSRPARPCACISAQYDGAPAPIPPGPSSCRSNVSPRSKSPHLQHAPMTAPTVILLPFRVVGISDRSTSAKTSSSRRASPSCLMRFTSALPRYVLGGLSDDDEPGTKSSSVDLSAPPGTKSKSSSERSPPKRIWSATEEDDDGGAPSTRFIGAASPFGPRKRCDCIFSSVCARSLRSSAQLRNFFFPRVAGADHVSTGRSHRRSRDGRRARYRARGAFAATGGGVGMAPLGRASTPSPSVATARVGGARHRRVAARAIDRS